MEKMGWTTGCGLGKNLQGPPNNIRVCFKNDNKGMGFKSTAEDLEHQDTFNKLLEELNGGVKHEVKVSSLEQQSQQSRARLHYQKFTRGKDLSRCSGKDLQAILGKNVTCNEEDIDKKFGAFTINGGNTNDYFRKKLINESGFDAKKEYTHEVNFPDDLHESNEINYHENKSLSVVPKVEEYFESASQGAVTNTSIHTHGARKRKKKLKTRVQEFVSQVVESECAEIKSEYVSVSFKKKKVNEIEACVSEMLVDLSDNKEVLHKKKHKLHKRKDRKHKVLETTLSEDELNHENVKKERKIVSNICEPVEEMCDNEDKIVFEASHDPMLEGSEVVICGEQDSTLCKKKSKKKKRKTSEKHEMCDEKHLAEDVLQESITTGISKTPAVNDCGFKGSNIMCIKGYGVS
ncbi:PIN2/TERF1-interacting telomerase inhibitor 1 isoform X2 [Bacillus rossius redtenbacheri]